MLHRGQYAVDANGKPAPRPQLPPRSFKGLLGIDENFTPGDKLLAAAIFSYTMFWFFVFVVISLWNIIRIWPDSWWSNYWFYAGVVVPVVLGSVTSVWFTIGGYRDLRNLFKRLRVLKRDTHNDGRVVDTEVPPAIVRHPETTAVAIAD